MAYKVCDATSMCVGDVSLAIEDCRLAVHYFGIATDGCRHRAEAHRRCESISRSEDTAAIRPARHHPAPTMRRSTARSSSLRRKLRPRSRNDSARPPRRRSPSPSPPASSPDRSRAAMCSRRNQIPLETLVDNTPGRRPKRGPPRTPTCRRRESASDDSVSRRRGWSHSRWLAVAHYVFVDRQNAASAVPPEVQNRIALVKGSGTFAQIANTVAPFNPAGILIITSVDRQPPSRC